MADLDNFTDDESAVPVTDKRPDHIGPYFYHEYRNATRGEKIHGGKLGSKHNLFDLTGWSKDDVIIGLRSDGAWVAVTATTGIKPGAKPNSADGRGFIIDEKFPRLHEYFVLPRPPAGLPVKYGKPTYNVLEQMEVMFKRALQNEEFCYIYNLTSQKFVFIGKQSLIDASLAKLGWDKTKDEIVIMGSRVLKNSDGTSTSEQRLFAYGTEDGPDVLVPQYSKEDLAHCYRIYLPK